MKRIKNVNGYEVVFYYHKRDGVWYAEALSLPGCITYGKTLKEAEEMIIDAINLYLENKKVWRPRRKKNVKDVGKSLQKD